MNSGNSFLRLHDSKNSELLDNDPVLHNSIHHKHTVITDFILKEVDLFAKNRKSARLVFKLADYIAAQMDPILQQLRTDDAILVGVHMRRGDYREFSEGKMYFTDHAYKNVMHRFLQLIPESKIIFIMCSDEPVELANFEGLPVFYTDAALEFHFYLLQHADYIIGHTACFR